MSVSRLRILTRKALPILALALGAALAFAVVSCGGRDEKGLLPGDTADQIVTNLDSVERAASEGSCTSAAEEATIDFLRELKPAGERAELGLFHASPRDPVWEYVLSIEQATDCLRLQPQRVALIGHSHVALYFSGPDEGSNDDVRGVQAIDGAMLELGEGRWLVNPGSVGQPRDGDPRAAWLEIDTGEWTARYHRVEYEIDQAADAISKAGLPKHLGDRLYVGQ